MSLLKDAVYLPKSGLLRTVTPFFSSLPYLKNVCNSKMTHKVVSRLCKMQRKISGKEVESSGLYVMRCKMVHLELQCLGLLPAEALVGTKVTVLGRLEVDGLGQVKLLDNDTRPHVKVLLDNLHKLVAALLRSAVGLNKDGEGLGNTNGVRQLNQSAAGQASGDQRLGDPTTKVGSRAIDLGEILSRESTTTVGTPSTVGIDNDLATSQTSVTLRTTDDEEAGGLNLHTR